MIFSRNAVLGVVLANLIVATGSVPSIAAEPAILTISGTIDNTNRGPSSEDDATMLGANDIEFENGFTLDRAALAALPQKTYDAPIPATETIVQFSGPLLVDILDLAGAKGEKVFLTALDGYGMEIELDYINTHSPIVAIEANGASLAVGDLGPAVSVFPPTDDPELAEQFAVRQIWALYHIGVE